MQELTLEQPLRVNKPLRHKATYMIQEPKTNQGFKHKEFTMKTSASTQNIFIASLASIGPTFSTRRQHSKPSASTRQKSLYSTAALIGWWTQQESFDWLDLAGLTTASFV